MWVCFWGPHSTGSGHVRLGWWNSNQCVCDGEHVCELLSLRRPCRAPVYLSGSLWSIMLSDCPKESYYSETTQHISSEMQVSFLCAALIPHRVWMQMSCFQWPSRQTAQQRSRGGGLTSEIFAVVHILFVFFHIFIFLGILDSVMCMMRQCSVFLTLTGDLLMQVRMQLCPCRLPLSLRQI